MGSEMCIRDSYRRFGSGEFKIEPAVLPLLLEDLVDLSFLVLLHLLELSLEVLGLLRLGLPSLLIKLASDGSDDDVLDCHVPLLETRVRLM